GGDDGRHLLLGPVAAADVHQRAGDGPDHVVQEAVRLHVQPDPVAEAVDGDVRDGADAAGAVGPFRLETAEVVGAGQRLRGSGHRGGVEGVARAVAVAAHEQVGHGPVVDDVAVEFADGVAVGVESVRCDVARADDDVLGQVGVDGPEQHGGGEPGGAVGVDDPAHRVNARVGTAAGAGP